jgi:acetoin utilization protein AcuB
MLVKYWMSKPPITIDVNAYIKEADELLKKNTIRQLPVVEDGKLVGLITDKDIKRAAPSEVTRLEHITELYDMISNIQIRDIMIKNPVTIPLDYPIDKAASVLLDKKLSGAPVVDNEGELVGVITQTDIFRVLVSFTGVDKPGVQLAFELEDRPGSIKEVTDIIRKYDCRMFSILTNYKFAKEGYRLVFIRVSDCAWERLEQLEEELKATATLLYVGDDREVKKVEPARLIIK